MVEIFDLTRKKELEVYFKDIEEYYKMTLQVLGIIYDFKQNIINSIKREFVFLFVHGMLHLLGYDHMVKKDEEVMFGLQDKIVGDLK